MYFAAVFVKNWSEFYIVHFFVQVSYVKIIHQLTAQLVLLLQITGHLQCATQVANYK